MTEQYGFKFVVDANDAAKGWGQFQSAVDGVFASMDRMEAHVEKTMGAVNKATKSGRQNIAGFTKAVNDLGKVRVNASASKNIKMLNEAMRNIKAPNASQVRNLRGFFKALENAGRGGGAAAAKNIAAISSAMKGFKAPTAAQAKNLREFFKALALFPRGNFTNAAGLLSMLRQLSGFKAPTAAQIKNLNAFLMSLKNLQMPRNAGQIARNLERIARSASRASGDLRGLRGAMGVSQMRRFSRATRTASVNMMGLQNAMSATYQMGSLLRSLFGALTIAELGRSFFEATNRLVTFNASMKVISDETSFANEQLNFITDTAQRLALNYGSAATAFQKFAISSETAGASAAQARDIFEGFGTAMTVMGLAADKQNDVMLALQQVMNKGYLAGEELNQQLNEHLPGALGYLRQELEGTGWTLEDALKKKAIDATQGLLFLASKYREEFGPALEEALNRPSAQMEILRTNITKLFESMAANGLNDSFTGLLKRINAYMRPEDIEAYGKAIGEKLSGYVDKLTEAIDWLFRNWDRLKGPISTTLKLLGQWMIISGSLQITQMLVQPIWGAVGAFRSFIPVASQSLNLMRAMTATSMVGFTASVRKMNPETLAMLKNFRGVNGAIKGISTRPLSGMAGMLKNLNQLTVGVKGAFLGLAGAIAGGLAIAMGVARDENKQYAHDSYTTTEIVKGFFLTLGDNIASIWNTATTFMAEKFGWVGTAISGTVSWLQDFFKQFFLNLSFGFAKVGEGIVKSFRVAFDAVIGMISQVGKSLYRLFTGDFAGAGNAIMNVFTPGINSFQSNFDGFLTDLPGQRQQFETDVGRGYEVVSGQLARYGERGRGSNAPRGRRDDVSVGEQLDSLYEGNILRDPGEEDEDGKKKRRGRQRDPVREAQRRQRRIDNIMRRIAEDNPLLKLQQEFNEDLGRQAENLLSREGYTQFMQDIAKHGGDAQAIMQELQSALSGAGGDQQVLQEIAQRYGYTVDDINALLGEQYEAYKRNRREIEIDQTFGARAREAALQDLQLASATADQQQVLATVIDTVNDARQRGIDFTQQDIDQLQEQLSLQQRRLQLLNAEREFYENNPLRQFKADILTVGEAVHELDRNFLGSLKDQIKSLGTEGTFSFGAIIDSIQGGLMEFAAGGITDAIGGLLSNGDPQNPTIFGSLFSAMGFGNTGFDAAAANQRIDAQNVQLYGDIQVNGMGQLFGGGLGNQNGSPFDEFLNPLQDEIARPMISAVEQTGEVMKQDWSQNIQGIGGMMQQLFNAGGMPGAGGALGSILSLVGSFGLFKEGGISTNPVQMWRNAPHYAEGTHNTTNGIPAVLHDNEAVIPLSRNRKVPVELTSSGGNGSGTVIHQNFNINTPDAGGVKRSEQQITGRMHRAANRAYMRNN